MSMSLRSALLAAALTCGLGTAAVAQGYAPLPPLRAEIVPPPPGTRYVWEPGHWVWNGRAYVWSGGHYVIRRAAYHEYIHGHWVEEPGRPPFWVGPHWR
jgi:hypothetical protein